MDAKLAYWTWAWVNMVAAVGFATAGIRRIRAGEVERHRRSMLTAIALVLLFLASYLVKVATLGREALETWSVLHVVVLRVHELCVLVMVVAGAIAVTLAVRHRFATRAEPAVERVRRTHRRAGWTSAVAAALGIVTAAVILVAMYQRAA